jgi:hypothetical protein
MNMPTHSPLRLFQLILLLAVAVAVEWIALPASAALGSFIRPDFQNLTWTPTNSTTRELGVISYSGHLVGPSTPAPNIPKGGGYVLQDSAFGQPFSPYVIRMSTNNVEQTYGDEALAGVLSELYPSQAELASKTGVQNSHAAFRYEWLLYAPSTTNGVTRTVADFDGISGYYGDPERALVAQQITNLVQALVVSPLHNGLQQGLLNAYTDRATAEMQFSKQDLVTLGKLRLGLTQSGQFIIDDEITLVSNIVARLDSILLQYNDLLSPPIEGVEPTDFDGRWPTNTPFGYYIFVTQQPIRNANAPQCFNTNGTLVYVPDYDPVKKEIPRVTVAENFTDLNNNGFYDAGEPFADANTNGIYDSGTVLFNGYKDYTTLLDVMGDYVKYSAELAKFLGMRQGPGDMAQARTIITGIQSGTATDYALLKGIYAGVTFPPGDASGVNAALGGVESAMGDTVNVRTFLQGRGNILGLDENFMVFVQDGTGLNNTYDVLKAFVYNSANPSTPVQAALDEQTSASALYDTYRASVDQVVQELGDVQSTYDDRFQAITGYSTTEASQWDGYNPKPGASCDLATVDQNLLSYSNKQVTLARNADQLVTDITQGNAAIGNAQGIGTAIQSAQQAYLNVDSSAWDAIQINNALAAAADATANGAEAGASSFNEIGGAAAALIGAANGDIQGSCAADTATRQKNIDQAAIGFQSALAKAQLPLTISQAKLDLGSTLRDQYANQLDMQDNANAIAQAVADRKRLLDEVVNIQKNHDDNQQSIRTRYYADPIHLVRSDNQIIKADAAFDNAQRWMFYLQRSLEYKWNQNFVGSYAGRNYDSGSIFKMRNAQELKDLYTALENFNNTGSLGFSQSTSPFDAISLRKLLVPNPNILNSTNTTDPGMRVDTTTGEVVTEREMFRRQLHRLVDGNGNLVIPVNTTHLSDVDYPSFFIGPLYAASGAVIRNGRWHDVVRYVKVNIVSTNHVGSPQAVSAQVTYSGSSFFRTRVTPCGLPGQRLNNTLDSQGRDIPGEFITWPFHTYFQVDFNVPVFKVLDNQPETGSFALSGNYVRNMPPLNDASQDAADPLSSSFKFNAFTEYSVAATGWVLTIYANPNVNLDLIDDVEFVVAHRSANRVVDSCN